MHEDHVELVTDLTASFLGCIPVRLLGLLYAYYFANIRTFVYAINLSSSQAS